MTKFFNKIRLNSFQLHIIAMTFMFIDHLWGTVIAGNKWMTCIGRLAFPIFAFMIVEGYFHTSDFKKYLKRLFILALISEIPYNLMMEGSLFTIFAQNVIWTFIIGLICIRLIDNARKIDSSMVIKLIKILAIVIVGFLIGMIGFVDYYGFGVLMVILFYFTHDLGLVGKIAQVIGLYYINVEMISGETIPLFGFDVTVQGFAILSLIFIWLYNGEQGPHSKMIRNCFYLFYPIHILILSLISLMG